QWPFRARARRRADPLRLDAGAIPRGGRGHLELAQPDPFSRAHRRKPHTDVRRPARRMHAPAGTRRFLGNAGRAAPHQLSLWPQEVIPRHDTTRPELHAPPDLPFPGRVAVNRIRASMAALLALVLCTTRVVAAPAHAPRILVLGIDAIPYSVAAAVSDPALGE